MYVSFDTCASKKSADLSVNSDLLLQAKAADKWRKENADAIAAYSKHVEKHGTFGDKVRSF